MKKILFVLLLILLILLGYFLFFRDGKNPISDFFNDGADFGSFFDVDPQSQNDFISDPIDNTDNTTPTNSQYVAPVLRQISYEPVSGFTYYATTSTSTRMSLNQEGAELIEEFAATSTVIRFQERATGHMYDVFEFKAAPTKVSNITIQKIYNTIFSNNENVFLYQTPSFNNEEIKTTYAQNILPQAATGTTPAIEQSILKDEISTVISEFVHLKSTNKLFYAIERVNGTDFYTSDLQRNTETPVSSVSFKEITLDSINDQYILLQTKASANTVGYAYTLNISNGIITKFIGNVTGLLTKMSPSMKYYLYSESDRTRPILRSYDVDNNITRRIGLDTLPQKCAFSKLNDAQMYCFGSLQYKAASYPDDWYKGKVFNPENLYRIDLATGLVEVVYSFIEPEDPTQNFTDFDVMKVDITNNDNHIIFQNKIDLTLWSINLNLLNNAF